MDEISAAMRPWKYCFQRGNNCVLAIAEECSSIVAVDVPRCGEAKVDEAGQKEKARGYCPRAFILSRRRPTFPRSCPRSIIGDAELNCRVRNGNGCVLRSMITGNLGSESVLH